MKKTVIGIAGLLLLSLSSLHAAGLTSDQCKAFKDTKNFELTDDQIAQIVDMCKAQYSSENARVNCASFTREEFLKQLEEAATALCKS